MYQRVQRKDAEFGTSSRHLSASRQREVHDVLRGSGQPLPRELKDEMEARLGEDFSQVRVHADGAARASAAKIGARAYTLGDQVVIGAVGADRHTLAHELTHVIQQRDGRLAGSTPGAGLRVSDPSDRFEREAEANASRVMAMGPAERGPVVDRLAAQSQPSADLVQRAPIGEGGENYRARKSAKTFLSDHLAENAEGAERAARARHEQGRGDPRGEGTGAINTVLHLTEPEAQQKVLNADFDSDTSPLGGSVWAVKINCSYWTVSAQVGGNNNVGEVTVSPEESGPVWLKVLFIESEQYFSITGVKSVGPTAPRAPRAPRQNVRSGAGGRTAGGRR